MLFDLKIFGVVQARTRFNRMGAAALNPQPALTAAADLMMDFIERTFKSQGRRGGGSWKALTIEWAERKGREGLDPRIGYAEHYLSQAFTVRGSPHQILEFGPHSVHLSSDLPYAGTQQEHRPFVKFTVADREEIAWTVREYLIAAWRAAPR